MMLPMMPVMRTACLLTALAATVGACNRPDEASMMQDTSAMGGMPGMEGMPGMGGMQSVGMMEQMQAHMRMMEGRTSDSLGAMMPMHRQMLANMIAQMNREMRDMNMSADATWNALTDSLRQDLRRMPELSARELSDLMPAHRARVLRLMERHRSMMGTRPR